MEILNAVIFMIVMIIVVGLAIAYVLNSLGCMKCLQKAGEDAWKGWVPFLNNYYMYKIVGMKGGLVALNIVYTVIYIIFMIAYINFMGNIYSTIVDYDGYILSDSYYGGYYDESDDSDDSYLSSSSTIVDSNDMFEEVEDSMIVFSILYVLILCLVIAIFVINILFAINISKSFGLGGGTIAGMILIPTIFLLIIGFGKSKYVGNYNAKGQKV